MLHNKLVKSIIYNNVEFEYTQTVWISRVKHRKLLDLSDYSGQIILEVKNKLSAHMMSFSDLLSRASIKMNTIIKKVRWKIYYELW